MSWEDGRIPQRTAPRLPQEDAAMAKKSRKKKARKHSKANHGKRPNS